MNDRRDRMALRPARADDEAAVLALLRQASLPPAFVAAETAVAEHDGAVVATARSRPVAGGHELAGVAVRADLRGSGLGRRLVAYVLEAASGPVYALAVAPGFFERIGFRRLEAVPEALQDRVAGECASTRFVALAWEADRPVWRERPPDVRCALAT